MKNRKWTIIIALIAIVGGIIMFQQYQRHQEELKRNREYEVSLVNALKNSYEGIEEIRITDPNYTMPPGDWSCDVEILFNDKEVIKYGLGHSLKENQNYGGRTTYHQRDFLNSRKGKTNNQIIVIYSNGEEGKQ